MKRHAFVKRWLPNIIENCLISIYNTNLYRKRRGGQYTAYKAYFNELKLKPQELLLAEQERRLTDFLNYTALHSKYYAQFISPRDFWSIDDLRQLPVLEKKDLLEQFDDISTIREKDAWVSYTGGTTGNSMRVLYTSEGMQERIACLDVFREQWGYRLGEKTAWFTGKELLSTKDLKKNNFFKVDYINNIYFFSTFHMSQKNFPAYWSALEKLNPKFLVGFPSNVAQLCHMAESGNVKYKNFGQIKAFFSTAELVTPAFREIIKRVLGCDVVDQYASSEGAPFIFQCHEEKMHMDLLSGVFEIVDEEMKPAREGRILVTSFSTRGMPLIRYNIGDTIALGTPEEVCACGSSAPLVQSIDGRANDFIYSPWTGRVNAVNAANAVKGIQGIVSFQIYQEDVSEITINVVGDEGFNATQEKRLLAAFYDRLGSEMSIHLKLVTDIAREKSGKFRLIKNSLNFDEL